jgi:hypothetical protein
LNGLLRSREGLAADIVREKAEGLLVEVEEMGVVGMEAELRVG